MFRFLANRFLRKRSHHSHAVEQNVEWCAFRRDPLAGVNSRGSEYFTGSSEQSLIRRMYAFDVHCNSYFPLFLLLYGETLAPRVECRSTLVCNSPHHSGVSLWPCPNESVAAVGQFFISPVLLWHSFLASVLSNAVYAAAFSYYHYLSFLGYSALPFLEHTEVSLCLSC